MPEENTYKDFEKEALFAIETEKLANIGGWLWDITQDSWTLSDNWLRIHGCTKRHLSTSELLQIAHPDDIADIQEAFDSAINKGVNYEIEHRIIRQDTGEERYVRACGITQLDGDGKAIKIFGSAQDITDRQKAETRLIEREARFRTLFENMFDAVVVVDRSGFIRFVNPAASQLFGRDVKKLIGQSFGFPVTESKTFEMEIIRGDGSLRYAEMKASRVEWMGESVHIASIRDNTEKILSQAKREEMNAHLQQLQKMEAIGTLAGGIAHDFNNILTPILGYAELVFETVKEDPILKDCMREIIRSSGRAKDLVSQILTFSRQSKKELHPLFLSPIVKEVMKLIRSTLPTTIEIQQNITSKRVVLGDATQIHQILMNLCTNAKLAMENTGGCLSVSLEDVELSPSFTNKYPDLYPGDYIRLRVEDTGHGMNQSVMGKIFQPYFTTRGKEEGTGLGLSVVHGIVKEHGGSISVKSEVGKGTVFEVYLPCTDVEKSPEKIDIAEPKGGTEHILVVDDEPAIAKLHQQILERLGYQITIRTSSIEALELFKSKPEAFDLILSDMTMPKMSGDILASECARIRPDIPIILGTGFSEKITVERAQKMGINTLLYKPISRSDLANAIRKALDETGERGENR